MTRCCVPGLKLLLLSKKVDYGYLLCAQVEAVAVEQELRLVEKLRRELLDIAAAVKAVIPGGRHIREEAVCMVKPAAL